MPLLLGILIVLVHFWLLSRNEEKGIMLYCILLITCPVTIIGGASIYYSYLSFPFLVLWYITHKKRVHTVKYLIPLVFVLIWDMLVTIVVSNMNIGHSANYIAFIGTFRNIAILYILSKQPVVKDKFISIIGIVIAINCAAMLVQLTLLQMWGFERMATFWLGYYGTLGSSGSLEYMMELGASGRLQGTFASSAFPGTLSVVGLGISLIWYFDQKKWQSIFLMAASLFLGFCSSSKRFFLGSVVIITLCLLVCLFWNKRKSKNFDYKLPIFLFIAIIAVYAAYFFLNDILSIDYYMGFLFEGNFSGSLESRFGEDEGIVNSMIPYIKKYWLTGLGETQINNVLVTDSDFYVSLFKTGIIGLFAYALFFGTLLRKTIVRKEEYVIIVLSWLIFEFFISTEFATNLGVLFTSFILSSICTKDKIIIKKHGK